MLKVLSIIGMQEMAIRRRLAVVLGCCIYLVAVAVYPTHAAEPALQIDFERPGLAVDWSAVKTIAASRVAVPEVPAEIDAGPAGMGLAVNADGGGLFLRAGKGPEDWTQCDGVSFWVHRSANEAKRRAKSAMEVQIYEKDGGARFWRKVELDHTGWKQVDVPLKWFRWSSGRVPRWERADRMGLWFRDDTEVVIDTIVVAGGQGGENGAARPAELSVDDIRKIAFPSTPADDVTVVANADVRLLTDAPDLDAKRLAAHLSDVADQVRKDLSLERPSIRPVLVVFATDDAYRAFPPRLAEQLNAASGVPTSSGYTLHGISTSSWSARWGTLRPVYTHEYVHGLIARSIGVANSGEWFQEGLASYYQVRFHPQESLGKIVRTGISQPTRHLPLPELCNGKPISGNRYWQALSLIGLLIQSEEHAPHLPKLLAAIGRSGATDLAPHLPTIFKTDWQQLTADWKQHCRETYGE